MSFVANPRTILKALENERAKECPFKKASASVRQEWEDHRKSVILALSETLHRQKIG